MFVACRVPCDEVAQTFSVWRRHPSQLVGWFPRGVQAAAVPRWRDGGRANSSRGYGGAGIGGSHGSRQGAIEGGGGGGGVAGCRYSYLSRDHAVLVRGTYTLVLTKGAFLHRDWLTTYTAALPSTVRCKRMIHLELFDICETHITHSSRSSSPDCK